MSDKPTALELGARLEQAASLGDMGRKPDPKDHRRKAASELRRQHSRIEADEALMRQTLAQMEDLHRFYTHIFDRSDGCATIMAASIPAFEDSIEKHTDGITALRKRLESSK